MAGAVVEQAQRAAAQALTDAVEAHGFKPFLLEGVTGAGKTEVYFEAIAEALRTGKMGVMDLYRMNNMQADTDMRKSIGTSGG